MAGSQHPGGGTLAAAVFPRETDMFSVSEHKSDSEDEEDDALQYATWIALLHAANSATSSNSNSGSMDPVTAEQQEEEEYECDDDFSLEDSEEEEMVVDVINI
jgi:hypothetical protein